MLSIKSECLSRLVLCGERHLRVAVAAYVHHYHEQRPHQGLAGILIEPDETAGRARGAMVCRERLGGLLRYDHRQAA